MNARELAELIESPEPEARSASELAGPRLVHLRYAPVDAWAEADVEAVRTLCGTSRAPGGPTDPEADVTPEETTTDPGEASCRECLSRAERQWWM